MQENSHSTRDSGRPDKPDVSGGSSRDSDKVSDQGDSPVGVSGAESKGSINRSDNAAARDNVLAVGSRTHAGSGFHQNLASHQGGSSRTHAGSGQPKQRESPRMGVLKSPSLHIVFGVTLTGIMGVASVTPILPMISDQFGVTPDQASLLIIIFTLPGVFLTPIFGVLGDLYGRKRVLIPILLLFAVAGTACFFAPDFKTLLILRFLQGIGAASLGAMNVTIISDVFHGNDRTAALGYNSGVVSFGAAVYPAIGGALSIIGWRYPFLLPILAVPTALLVLFKLKLPPPRRNIHVPTYLKSVHRTLSSRKIRIMFLLSTSTFMLIYGPILTFMPFYLEHYFSSSALVIGLIIASMSLGNLISGVLLGYLSMFFKTLELLLISYLMVAASLLMIPMMPNEWLIMIPCILFGFAIGINNPNIQTLIANAVRPEQRGGVLSVNGMVLRAGQTLGPVMMSTLFVFAGYVGAYILSAVLSVLIYLFLRTRM
ncbi:MAG: MFS transporter [Bacteroidetes bacterium]|nr:MFS transporter [Bacteroidota bacterium]